jgi:hypothetical protein
LAILSAFSFNIENLPKSGVNAFFNIEICQMLMTDGNALADKLRAHFAISSDEELHFKCKYNNLKLQNAKTLLMFLFIKIGSKMFAKS